MFIIFILYVGEIYFQIFKKSRSINKNECCLSFMVWNLKGTAYTLYIQLTVRYELWRMMVFVVRVAYVI